MWKYTCLTLKSHTHTKRFHLCCLHYRNNVHAHTHRHTHTHTYAHRHTPTRTHTHRVSNPLRYPRSSILASVRLWQVLMSQLWPSQWQPSPAALSHDREKWMLLMVFMFLCINEWPSQTNVQPKEIITLSHHWDFHQKHKQSLNGKAMSGRENHYRRSPGPREPA